MNNKNKVIVALSGGVDSAVSAFLLKEQGYDVSAMFMKNWEENNEDSICQSSLDLDDAQKVCDQLAIELHDINCSQEYWEKVFINFLEEYQQGKTPNPDILCNKEIKFNVFLHYAKQLGAQYIATGHYARIQRNNNQLQLLKAIDLTKDQSYFLYTLNQYQLSHTLFPIGDMHKIQVRQLAQKINLSNYAKKDSVGICFIGKRNFKNFLQQYLPSTPGKIVTNSGKVIGEHQGLIFYTIGQRKGLNIGGRADLLPGPWYVSAKDLENNILIVSQNQEPELYQDRLIAHNVHWINDSPAFPVKCSAKIRYRQLEQPCTVQLVHDSTVQVIFHEPQKAVAEGQSIVFYQEEVCLGGGIINYDKTS